PAARRRRRSEARGPEGSRRGRAHPAVATRALAGLKAHERLSIGHYMLRRWSLEEDVRHLERLGFRSISLASTKLGAYGVERAIRLVRATALKVAHVGSYGWFGTERQTIRKGIEQVRRAIEWVHRLNGDALFVISGGRDGVTWEAAARAYRDAYARLLPEATAAGTRWRSSPTTSSGWGTSGRSGRHGRRSRGWSADPPGGRVPEGQLSTVRASPAARSGG